MTLDYSITCDGINIAEYVIDTHPTVKITEGLGSVANLSLMPLVRKTPVNLDIGSIIEITHTDGTLFFGRVNSMRINDGDLIVNCADTMHDMMCLGSNYFYTHYLDRIVNQIASDRVDGSQLYLELPNAQGLNVTDAKFAVNVQRPMISDNPYSGSSYNTVRQESVSQIGINYRFRATDEFIHTIQAYMQGWNSAGTVTVRCRIRLDAGNNRPGLVIGEALTTFNTQVADHLDWRSWQFSSGIKVTPGQLYWVTFHVTGATGGIPVGGPTARIRVADYSIIPDGFWAYYSFNRLTSTSGGGIYAETLIDGTSVYTWSVSGTNFYERPFPMIRLNGAEHKQITSFAVSGNRLNIYAIEGVVQPIPISVRNPSTFSRGLISYYSGSLTIKGILQKIIDSQGYILDVPATAQKALGRYNCRGDYLISYITDLTSIREEDSVGVPWRDRMTLVTPSRTNIKNLIMSRRTDVIDNPDLTMEVGKDGITVFGITQTINNRPVVQFMSSKIQDPQTGTPDIVMVSAVDMNERLKFCEASEDSSIQNSDNAFLQAYALLDSIPRGAWEGKIKIHGIDVRLMHLSDQLETYGSGSVIQLKHPEIGFDEKVKVKSVTFNLDDYSTEAELSNVSEVANDRTTNLDRERLQRQSTSLELGDTDGYACLIEDRVLSITPNQFGIRDANGTLLAVTTPQIITAPRFNAKILHAFFPKGVGTINTPHGVAIVDFAVDGQQGEGIVLRESQLLDKFSDQSLTLDLVFRLS